jgi:DNA-binding NtrC family response regulator
MVKHRSLLIADDNKGVIDALKIVLVQEFSKIASISNPNQLISCLEKDSYDIVLLDMNFQAGINSGNEGIFWLREIKKKFPEVEVVMITAYGSIDLVVKALKEGATDFVLKPWENEKLIATLNTAYRLSKSNREIAGLKTREKILKTELSKTDPVIIGNSPAMQNILSVVKKLAPTEADILITGENGTGKELIAREIHRQSERSDGLFVHIDLSAIPESLFESELFGHKKGAFTDAHEDKTGKIVLAENGTLFLDEIGNIPLALQSKLLNVLQSRIVSPVGSNLGIPVSIRLVSATNKNLDEMVLSGTFRQDLLYRMNTIRVHLPPLRERTEDIEEIAGYYLKMYSNKYCKPGMKISGAALSKLKRNAWHGNIRELQHSIEKAVILADNELLGEKDFIFGQAGTDSFKEPITLESMEKMMIINALKNNRQNLSIISEQLGITRQTLYNKIKKYDL